MNPPSKPIRAALIDLDGTLVDTLGDFTFALNEMLQDLGLPAMAPSQVQSLIGRGSEHLIRAALTLQSGAAAAHDIEAWYPKAWSSYQSHYRRHNGQHAQVYPGVVPGLARMQALGWRLACVTNKPTEFARSLLERVGLATCFVEVVGGDTHPRKKPDPMPLLLTCQALSCPPEQTLMIGDSIYDAQAAHAAGCPLVLVTYGYHQSSPLASLGALQCVDRLDALSFDTLTSS